MKALEYLRKSQFDSDFDENSIVDTLARHEKILADFCKKTGIHVDTILKEVVSGESLSARPEMQKALEMINSGSYDAIVCMDIDRLSRGSGFDSGYIMQILQINNCKIITPAKTYDLSNLQDEQFTDLKFLFSRYELRTIKDRLYRGRLQSAKEGKFTSSVPPYGYAKTKMQGEKGYTLTVIPDQAEVVRMIFDMYVNQDAGYNTIAKHLNDLGIKTNTGRQWTGKSINYLIINPVYCGLMRWQYRKQIKTMVDGELVKRHIKSRADMRYKGLHEAIISEELYKKAEIIRETKTHPSARLERPIRNPFANIFRCGICGSRIEFRQPPKNYPHYRYGCSNRYCECKSINAEIIEDAVVKKMKNYLSQYKITIGNFKKDNDISKIIDINKKQLAELEKQQTKICELLEKGVYTIDLFTARNTKLTEQISTIKNTIKENEELEKSKPNHQDLIPITQGLLDSYNTLSGADKNKIWKQILYKVTYYKKKGTDVIITLYPKF